MSLELQELSRLASEMDGALFWDEKYKAIYATDASIYRKIPLAVAHPKSENDVVRLVQFASHHKTSLIPRTAGTSLAGQCVGEGIIVDTSRFLNQVLEINEQEKWVRVQPGVNRDKLNQLLADKKLFFPPETATASRAMIGGMVGNNSCGANSIVYGSTRDYVLEIKGILSDGSITTFKATDSNKTNDANGFVQRINTFFKEALADTTLQNEIKKEYPKKSIHRRNTGYAADLVLDELEHQKLDLTKLLCGSEGTLMISSEIKLRLVDPPPSKSIMIVPHFHSIHECMEAVVTIMKHKPYTCELMDRVILNCTDGHEVYKSYKFFVDGDPAALLVVEFRDESQNILITKMDNLIRDLKSNSLGYSFPRVEEKDHKKVWELRRAGLGLMANLKGNKKLVECIEDTAVALEDLPEYIREFSEIMDEFHQTPLYYAHAGAGEIHLRPLLNMHDIQDRKEFRLICEASARLVKKYKGSLSGEHGDGRLRGEFVPYMLGDKIYSFLKEIKHLWDPENIFNPGKITDAPKVDIDLRFDHEEAAELPETIFDFSTTGGFYHSAARCSGSADCRKQASLGGTMCPSFMATLNEKDTTRARANALREFYSKSDLSSIKSMEAVKEILDLCISCKGCHNECPSNVDMTMLKGEFMHQYYQKNRIPFRTKMVGKMDALNKYAHLFPRFSNWVQNLSITKSSLGISPRRNLPAFYKFSFRKWSRFFTPSKGCTKQPVLFFIDEFSNYFDVEIAIKAVKLLDKLGFPVSFVDHAPSGRAQFSKGLLPQAYDLARQNVHAFKNKIPEFQIVGLEPSCILSFRDEYPKILRGQDQQDAKMLSTYCFTIEEFIYNQAQLGNIDSSHFDTKNRELLIHGHCHQKALSKVDQTIFVLGIPSHHTVSTIPSGCCGMAGSFGYEIEHYELSMQIGDLVLFPAINKAHPYAIVVAAGISCRHQIKDGTGKMAMHPVEVLWEALV
ncbi:MAG: FAD-linked oxidase C-terminal domain-containing protein [Saprospiraceae bacterium]